MAPKHVPYWKGLPETVADKNAAPFARYASLSNLIDIATQRHYFSDDDDVVAATSAIRSALFDFMDNATVLIVLPEFALMAADIGKLFDAVRDYWTSTSSNSPRLKLLELVEDKNSIERADYGDQDVLHWIIGCLETLSEQLSSEDPTIFLLMDDVKLNDLFYMTRSVLQNIAESGTAISTVLPDETILSIFDSFSKFANHIPSLGGSLTSFVYDASNDLSTQLREQGREPPSADREETEALLSVPQLRSTAGTSPGKVVPALLNVLATSESMGEIMLAAKRLRDVGSLTENSTAFKAFKEHVVAITARKELPWYSEIWCRQVADAVRSIDWTPSIYNHDPSQFAGHWTLETLATLSSHLDKSFLKCESVKDQARSMLDHLIRWTPDASTNITTSHYELLYSIATRFSVAYEIREWTYTITSLCELVVKLQTQSTQLEIKHPHPLVPYKDIVGRMLLAEEISVYSMHADLIIAIQPTIEFLVVEKGKHDILGVVFSKPELMGVMAPMILNIKRTFVERGDKVPDDLNSYADHTNLYQYAPEVVIANLDWLVRCYPTPNLITYIYMDDPSGQRTPRPSALFPHVLTLFETFCNNANDPAAAIAASSMYGLIAQPEIQRHMVQNCLGSFLTDFVFDERRGEIIKTHFPYIWPAWTQNPSFAESLKPYWRTVVSKLKMVGYAFGAPLQTVFNMMDRETLVKELGDDGIESLYEGILATLKDPMLPVQPLVELLGIVGQANKEYAGKCLEKLVDVVEVAMPVMGAKIVTQYDVLRCISTMKTIAEATGPSVLTPIKDRLAEILKSPQAMQTHKDAAKELFDYEAGRSAQQIYELLGLDKSDPFLQTANDVLTSSATDPSSLFDVMISYTQSQLALAVRIANALRTRGLKVWIDREFGGKDVYTRMAEGVIRSCVIVPCISKAYEADADRKKELGFAADQKRKVVPIRLSDGPFTWSALITAGLLYTYLAKAQTEDEGKFSQAMDGLAKEVEAGVIEYKELNKIPIEPRKPAVTESPEDDMVVVPPALAVGEEAALKADGVKVLDEDGQEIVDDHDDGRYVGVEEEIRVQEKYDLMLSYAWSHQPTVLRMRDWLRARGFNVWMDVDLMSGNVYSKMAEAVLGSRVIVACLTGTYDRSGNCRRELGYSRDQVLEGRKRRMKQSVEERQAQDAAKKFGKGLVPVLLEDTQYVFAGPLTQGLKKVDMTPKAIEQSEAFERKMEELAILVRTLLDGGSIYLPGYGEDDLDAPIQATADQKEPVEDRISSLELQLERLISLQQLSSANRSGSPLSESFVVVSGSSGIRTSDADAALVLERVGSLEARMGRLEEKFVAFQVVFDEFATAFEVQQRKWANAQVERSANRGVSPVPLTPVTGSWTNPLGDGGPQQGARRESGGQGNTSAINTSLKAFADMFSSLASPGAKKAGE